MTSSVLVGFLYVLAAGIFQGVFLLPMDRARRWQWEHLARLFFLRHAGAQLASHLGDHSRHFDIYRLASTADLALLIIFGLGWGLGAVLFGCWHGAPRSCAGLSDHHGSHRQLGRAGASGGVFPPNLAVPEGCAHRRRHARRAGGNRSFAHARQRARRRRMPRKAPPWRRESLSPSPPACSPACRISAWPSAHA